jgi:hypothetical protein
MNVNLRTKKGAHVKQDSYHVGPAKGEKGAPGNYPGGYKGYMYIRAAPKDYEKTDQQKIIAQTARECSKDNLYQTKYNFSMQQCVAGEYDRVKKELEKKK